ncbi:MAG: hypothetical protein IJE79_03925 [Alphaproteobacteria bacterium]|nr:hypothetical protein [Alphaproteobacteria bacterium]
MKKTSIYLLFMIMNIMPATAASIPWWQQSTVCKINPTNCYSNMTNGYLNIMGDPESWDDISNCWGLKIICPDALTSGENAPQAMKRKEIENSNKIKPDYDINSLSDTRDCFGVRKATTDGTKVYVDGKLVNVWCNGILDNPNEILENGEITYGPQPTCRTLAQNNFATVLNGNCYGKYYDPSQYFIECGSGETPTRFIVLNGADYNTPLNGAPTTKSAAEKIFNNMFQNSKEQKSKYFAN